MNNIEIIKLTANNDKQEENKRTKKSVCQENVKNEASGLWENWRLQPHKKMVVGDKATTRSIGPKPKRLIWVGLVRFSVRELCYLTQPELDFIYVYMYIYIMYKS